MGIPVLVLGASGAGKSASLRNFSPDEVGVFNVACKPLPFKNKIKSVMGAGYELIKAILKKNSLKTYIIDDSQYLMAFEQCSRVKEPGYTKHTEMGLHFIDLVRTVASQTTDDTVVYFLHHIDRSEDGLIKAKTIGKLIDNWICLEGLFSIVLLATIENREHVFITQSDGTTTAKSPMGMLQERMENDLKAVDTAIRKYYFEEEEQ